MHNAHMALGQHRLMTEREIPSGILVHQGMIELPAILFRVAQLGDECVRGPCDRRREYVATLGHF